MGLDNTAHDQPTIEVSKSRPSSAFPIDSMEVMWKVHSKSRNTARNAFLEVLLSTGDQLLEGHISWFLVLVGILKVIHWVTYQCACCMKTILIVFQVMLETALKDDAVYTYVFSKDISSKKKNHVLLVLGDRLFFIGNIFFQWKSN